MLPRPVSNRTLLPARRRWLCVVALVTAVSASAAQAADGPPSDSAVVQYVEVVPTASGPKAPGLKKAKPAPLPPGAKRALKKTPAQHAKALEEIATSPDYGAPAPRPASSPATSVPPDAEPGSRPERTKPDRAKPRGTQLRPIQPPRTQPQRTEPDRTEPDRTEPDVSRALRAAVVAAAPVDDARMIGLLGVLALTTVGAAVLALRGARTA